MLGLQISITWLYSQIILRLDHAKFVKKDVKTDEQVQYSDVRFNTIIMGMDIKVVLTFHHHIWLLEKNSINSLVK